MTDNQFPPRIPADSISTNHLPLPVKKKRKVWPFVVLGVVILGLIGSCNGVGDGKQDQTVPAKTPAVSSSKAAAVPKPTLSPVVEKPVDTPVATGIPNEQTEAMMDAVFLSTVREMAPAATSVSDEILLQLARDTCAAFDAGNSAKDIVRELYLNAGDQKDNVAIVSGVGIGIYCPEYLNQLGSGM